MQTSQIINAQCFNPKCIITSGNKWETKDSKDKHSCR